MSPVPEIRSSEVHLILRHATAPTPAPDLTLGTSHPRTLPPARSAGTRDTRLGPCSSGANRDDIRQLLRDLNELYGGAAMAAYVVTLADLGRPHTQRYTPLQLSQAREKLRRNRLRPRLESSAFEAACDALWGVLDRTEGPLPRVLQNLKRAAYQEEVREAYREHTRGAASGQGSHSRDV